MSKRNDLVEKLDSGLHALFIQQIRNLHRKSIQEFLESLKVRNLKNKYS